MTFFNVIYFVAHFAERVTYYLFPRTRAGEWLMWFADDAKVLRRVASELALAEACHRRAHRPGAEEFVEHMLYYAALAIGERKYYGLQERWPSSVLRRLTDVGSWIDNDLWESGVYNGYSDVEDREDSVDYPEYIELLY
ncbi:hypothetical protein GW952_29235 (plasmid) [Klebsiella michiganensis]|uniref:Uncharacterized protein n=1 Tax=Klebsiella michiganensis TaxID=1134687 RepID=A0A6P1V4T7_9ENTR|nr:hypothetical protein [Klebsiella michiganensis]QHS48780.1 hypothetical protein GW952_25750 [Klebsiella michiganensis]QHS49723.1 hypothetical protein GW952_29235 [Klebsiella michiganensis]